ncbi:hypothetical protein M434DRAFT_391468, partial [Hypoxylon sp. CO27-5]
MPNLLLSHATPTPLSTVMGVDQLSSYLLILSFLRMVLRPITSKRDGPCHPIAHISNRGVECARL